MFVLLLAVVPAVLAGGWAVIQLDEMPGDIRPGEPWQVGFTVLQHGETPTHHFDGTPLEPKLTATNADTGERVTAVGTPTDDPGHFTLEVTFPSEGAWEWTIEPWPLIGQTVFEPLQVVAAPVPVQSEAVVEPAAVEPAVISPAVSAPQPANGETPPVAATSPTVALRWAALVVALAAVGLLVIQSRKRAAPQPQVES
jgi:hypothetical protein